MIYYFIVCILLLILDYYKTKINNFVETFCIIYIMLFMCGGFMCGSDWRSYELDYSTVSNLTDTLDEPGYYILSIFCRNLGMNFWIFNILLKILCYLVFWRFISTFSESKRYLSFLFFFSFYGIYLLIDAPLRNTCAVAIFLVAILSERKSKYLPWLLSIVSIFFHSSGIISFLYLVLKRFNIHSYIYILIYLLAIFISFKVELINNIVGNTLIGQLLFAEKISRYVDSGFAEQALVQSATSLGEILKIILFVFVIYNRKRIEIQNNGKVIFLGIMLFFILSKVGAAMDVLMRFGCYFSLFYAIGLVSLLNTLPINFSPVYKRFVIALSFFQTFATVTTDYRFIPYTNYFVYNLFNDMPSYSQRSQYNRTYSPYK